MLPYILIWEVLLLIVQLSWKQHRVDYLPKTYQTTLSVHIIGHFPNHAQCDHFRTLNSTILDQTTKVTTKQCAYIHINKQLLIGESFGSSLIILSITTNQWQGFAKKFRQPK